MEDEYKKTIEAVKFSIQMEIEGKNYYDNAASTGSNEAGRQLFEWLAEQEVKHKTRFEQIYTEISAGKEWPAIEFEPDATGRAKTVFADAVKGLGNKMAGGKSELDIVAGAIELEEKTHQYYLQRSKLTDNKIEKAFFESIADEENGHIIVLADYREYIIDPSGYFLKTEKHTLDGA